MEENKLKNKLKAIPKKEVTATKAKNKPKSNPKKETIVNKANDIDKENHKNDFWNIKNMINAFTFIIVVASFCVSFASFNIAQKSLNVSHISFNVSQDSFNVALESLAVSQDIAYGDANLTVKRVLYNGSVLETVGYYNYDLNNYSLWDLTVQFLVQNTGYGSTVYVVYPYDCNDEPHCLPKNITHFLIRYNNEKDYRPIEVPDINYIHNIADFQQIDPKSTQLVEIVYQNISSEDIPLYFEVKIIDYASYKTLRMYFYREQKSYSQIHHRSSR